MTAQSAALASENSGMFWLKAVKPATGLTDAISGDSMNALTKANKCSSKKAPIAPSASMGEALPCLKISWQVAPPQNVAIVDLSGTAGGYDYSALDSTAPDATRPRLQK
jgi:hypothetical protein